MPRGSTCKARGCTANKNDNPELSFHSFPRNKERFKLWCDLIKRPDLSHGKAITSRMSMRVCSLHFEDHMYMSPTNKSRLIWCAVPKPVEIKVLNTEEAAPMVQLLPEPEASEKTDVLSSYAEDIIVKEESDMDLDTNNDVPVPSCCPHENSRVEIFADTKVGILEQSQSGKCVEEKVESKSFQDDIKSCQASCSAKSDASGCITLSSSQLESMSPQSPVCSPNSFPVTQLSTSSDSVPVSQESPCYQSKPSKCDSCGPVADTISIHEDLYEKNKGDMEVTYEIGKNVCSEDCGCDKCFMAEEAEKKAAATKSIMRRTYSGPIRRQVVRTKNGGKRTIMIVNKASLKSLQARGLIRPITKYMANHPHGVQSLKKNIIQYGSVAADHSSRLLQSEDSLPSKEESSRKNSSIPITQPSIDEHYIRESDTEFRDEPYASSHTSQTLKSQTPNQDSQAPVTVSWAPVNGSNALSFTFTVTLPTEANKSLGNSQDPLQIATSLLNDGAHCTVNQPNSQARDPSDPNHMPSNQSDSDCCSFRTTSPTRNASTATFTHKRLNPRPFHVTNSGLPCEAGTEGKKIHFSKGSEENKEEDQLTKTRPKNRDSVQWIALPSVPVHQPQPSSSRAPEQIQQASLTNKCQMSNITPHSSEQSSVAYRAFPTASLDQRGKRLHIPPYRSPNKELKLKYARLLNKHRHRYYLLLKKYKILEEKFSAVKDVGTPQQVIRDAQKFLSEEHILFLESQMFLRNRPGRGNRFSRKFMKLMIEYYKRSAAGYRFLRTIFTIPSMKTIQKWLSKPIEFRNLDEDGLGDSREDSETGNDEEAYPPHKIKPNNICQDSNSYEKFSQAKVSAQNLEYEDNSADDYDSEESDPEEMEAEEAEHKC